MEANIAQLDRSNGTDEGMLTDLLRGFRFTVCETPETAAEGLEIRKTVYNDSNGYNVPVPDEYDRRSWLLLAEDTATGQAVGTMRLTPRFAATLEAEEYFELPAHLRTPLAIELTRFAILPPYRKGKTFIPVVSFGLFKLVHEFLEQLDARYMVVSSKPERMWTYEWMGFRRAGLTARYAKLNGAEHELLWYDFRERATILASHPFRDLFLGIDYAEVVLPTETPRLGLGRALRPTRAAASLTLAA